MSQSDFIIENQSGAQFRQDVQSALRAAVSCSIGRAAPTTTYAGQLWFDSEKNELKIRNEGNNAWIVFADTNSVLNAIRLRTSVLRAVDRRGITLEALNGADLLRVAENGDVSGVGIATAAQIAAGTADNKLLKVGSLTQIIPSYESPETTIPIRRDATMTLTFIHGLGVRAKTMNFFAICKIRDYGWNVGRQVKLNNVTAWTQNNTTIKARLFGSISIRTGPDFPPPRTIGNPRDDPATLIPINVSRWKLIVRAGA